MFLIILSNQIDTRLGRNRKSSAAFNSRTPVFGEKRHVLEVPYFWRHTVAVVTDFYDVKTKSVWRRRRTKRPDIGRAGAKQNTFFCLINRMKTRHKCVRRARLHLNKNQYLLIATNQIDLVAPILRTAPVARHDFVAVLFAKEVSSQPLTLGTSASRIGEDTPTFPPILKTRPHRQNRCGNSPVCDKPVRGQVLDRCV